MLVTAYVSLQGEGLKLPKLIVVGNKHAAYDAAQAAAQASPIPSDIVFINFVAQEDLNMLYSAAEIFVFPSLNEGFGLPIIEAFASGTPVITSNVTSMPEIAGEAALLVEPSDVSDIAAKIKQLLLDRSLQDTLVKKGIARARDFSWKATAQDTVKLYGELLNR
jgi:glycosyltransferase involved in cell wall biosynthesis